MEVTLTAVANDLPDNQRLLRLSIGLEDPADLIEDLATAFATL